MFPHRGLFLAVTISLKSVVLANVIVQPDYDHFGKNPYYSQPASHQINSQTEEYHTKQLPNQELPYHQSARTYPYYESKDYSNLGYPYHPFHHYSPYHHFSPRNHPHYARIGSHEYSRPSVFVGYRQPSIGNYHWGSPHYHRYRRSLDSDSTNTESSESTNVAHDNDVASKSPLTDDKYPKATDSLLPEHEPTDTNDKHVENRQIKIDHIMKPHLFGIHPQNIQLPEQHTCENTMQGIMKFVSNPSTVKFDENSQENGEAYVDENLRLLSNTPSKRIKFEKFPEENNDSDNDYNSKYRYSAPDTWGNYFTRILLDNMKHQWGGYYNIHSPSYVSLEHTLPKRVDPLMAYYIDLLKRYKTVLQIVKKAGIAIPYSETRPNMMKLPIPSYRQQFSSTTDAPITKNEEDSSWTPDTTEITRYLEQDLPESYIPLVSGFDQGNYPHHCSNCRKDTPNYSSDDFEDNSNFQRNYNSAHNIKPSISIPNYSYIPNDSNDILNYDPNYAPDIDISVIPDYEIDKN